MPPPLANVDASSKRISPAPLPRCRGGLRCAHCCLFSRTRVLVHSEKRKRKESRELAVNFSLSKFRWTKASPKIESGQKAQKADYIFFRSKKTSREKFYLSLSRGTARSFALRSSPRSVIAREASLLELSAFLARFSQTRSRRKRHRRFLFFS